MKYLRIRNTVGSLFYDKDNFPYSDGEIRPLPQWLVYALAHLPLDFGKEIAERINKNTAKEKVVWLQVRDLKTIAKVIDDQGG